MVGRKRMTIIGFLLLIGLLGLCSCGSPSSDSEPVAGIEMESTTAIEAVKMEIREEESTEETAEFEYESSMELDYAENFKVDYYTGGYTLLTTIMDNRKFLIVPEGKKVPEDLEEDVVVLQRPIKALYLVASSVMVEALARKKGISMKTRTDMDYQRFKESQYDKLADTLREYLNMEEIYGMLREAQME